jgi:hypothetical protein
MHNPKCFYELKFPFDSMLRHDLDLSWYPESFPDYEWGEKRIWGLQYPKIESILSQDAIEFFSSIGFQSNMAGPGTVNLFRGDPGVVMGIHHDMGPRFSINYSWGSLDNDMVWYEFKTTNPKTYSKPSTTGRPTDYFYPEDLNEVGRVKISMPTLVRVDLAHHAVNMGSTTRWGVSVRDPHDWTWEEAVEFFQPWIV